MATQIEEIKVFDEALRDALALMAARGDHEARDKKHYARTSEARARFDRVADALFFPALWERLAALHADGKTGEAKARVAFLKELHAAAGAEFEAALPAIPCAAIHRPRAETRAGRAFTARVRRGAKQGDFHILFEREPADA